MYTLEITLSGLLAAAFLPTCLAIARRHERRRPVRILQRANPDDRDSLARFYRIMGR